MSGSSWGPASPKTGNEVICVDKDEAKVRALQKGKMPIYEPGLEELVQAQPRREAADVHDRCCRAPCADSQIVFIAVGTPQGEDGSADLQHVLGVARDVGRAMNGYKVIVDKSTVPVGTAEKVRDVIRRETTQPFSVVSNPEFLKQGAAIDDFMKPDRVVIGAEDPRGAELMKELYAPFTRTGAPIMMMDCASAELCKYAANAMLATRISFMNEIAQRLRARRRQRRSGPPARSAPTAASAPSFLFPGRRLRRQLLPEGRQGDPASSPKDKGYDFKILDAVEDVNQAQKTRLVEKMEKHFGIAEGQDHRAVGPGVQAAHRRHARGAGDHDHREPARRPARRCRRYDPEATETAKKVLGTRSRYVEKSYDALTGADALALVTEWNEFREPDFARMQKLMRQPVVFDGRNIYNPEHMRALGFTYFSIGR